MFTLTVDDENTIRRVKLAGDLAGETEENLQRALFAAGSQPPLLDLLVDLRAWGETAPAAAALRLVKQHYKNANRTERKLAILDLPERLEASAALDPGEPGRFCQAQVFATPEQAEAWLLLAYRDPLLELLRQAGPLAVLERYGLQAVLSDQDDPGLWAAALLRHWESPGDPTCFPGSLRFGIGRLPDQATGVPRPVGQAAPVTGAGGMEMLETWYFERLDDQRLRCTPQPPAPPAPSAPLGMGLPGLGLGAFAGLPASLSFQAWSILEISRPSLGESRALVHAGNSAGPLAGFGETRWWQRLPNGGWQESEERFSQWIS